MILQEFQLFQRRGTNETTATIEKRWKNLKISAGKCNREFFFSKFSPSKKDLTEPELENELQI